MVDGEVKREQRVLYVTQVISIIFCTCFVSQLSESESEKRLKKKKKKKKPT